MPLPPSKCFLLLIGLPGAGKSTFARLVTLQRYNLSCNDVHVVFT